MRVYKELDADWDFESVTPQKVKTGFTYAQAATELEVYHFQEMTIVVTVGEFSNRVPVWTPGTVSVENVLADYRREMLDALLD